MSPKDQNKSFQNRILAFQIFLLLFIALIILRLFIISVAQHPYYQALAEGQHSFFEKLVPKRGEIFITDKYSSQPYVVAGNLEENMVYAVPKEVQDPAGTAARLAQILNLDEGTLQQKLSDQSKWYEPIMHQLTDSQSSQIQQAKLAGIYLDPEDVRYYPQGNFLSQVIGFLGYKNNGVDKTGLYGLERYFNNDLSGIPGTITTQSQSGNWITDNNRYFTPATNGDSLLLTIDRSIEYKAESALAADVQKHGADSGAVIVANPKTGAILAMANYPGFDPNQYGKVSSPSVYQNLATVETYEPGSTMKGVTMAGALQLGLITPDSIYTDTGVVNIDGYKIENSDHRAHGLQTMSQVIDWSLNTGAIYVENLEGNDNFLNNLKKFGFGAPTNIDLPENVGNISNLTSPNAPQVNFDTAAFGQGITVTPIQMLTAYMAIANGGKLMQPYIVAAKILPDGKTEKTEPKEIGQIISPETATMDTEMLLDDVNNGYGKKAGVAGYDIAGKTGTAQVAKNGVYDPTDNIGSFVGFGPIEDPKFIMIVVINHPRDASFAETTATPLFSNIAQFILDYYNLPPNH